MSSRGFILLGAGLLLLLGCKNLSAAPEAAVAHMTTLVGTVLVPYSSATHMIELNLAQSTEPVQLSCVSQACVNSATDVREGDAVTLEIDRTGEPGSVIKVVSLSRPVGLWFRFLAFGGSFIFLFMLSALAVRWKPWTFLIGADNRYSNSQCQMVLWFCAVATMYLGTLALRVAFFGWDYLGGIGITANVAAVTGLSALSFGGAKAITMSKIESAAEAGLPPVKIPAARPSLRSDLFVNDYGRADFGDFQMILITFAAVAIFVGQAIHAAGMLPMSSTVTLPNVDSSLLAGFGIGQGAYLFKKAALKAGEG
jgi:hypothetical protein